MPLHLPLNSILKDIDIPTPNPNTGFRPGNTGVDQFTGEDRAVVFRQYHQAVLEFRALAFVDGEGVGGFVFRHAAGQDASQLALLVDEEDADAVLGFRVPQAQANVAVEEFQLVIVARHHHRAAVIVALAGLDVAGIRQPLFDVAVDPVHAEGTVAQGAEDAEAVELEQRLFRRLRPQVA